MSVKIAINGFGCIGRLAFCQMFGAEGFEDADINDLTQMTYGFSHDDAGLRMIPPQSWIRPA